MKKAKELLNLPIINMTEGSQVGFVKDLVIDPSELSVEFFIVGQGDWQVGVNALRYENVIGVGEFAVIVEGDQPLLDLRDIPLLYKKGNLNGAQVVTTGGDFAGSIVDYYFNEENGQLESLLINSSNQELFFPIENVISLGREFIMVNGSISDMIPRMEANDQQGAALQRREGQQNIKKEALKVMLSELMKKDLSKEINNPQKTEEE
ncbi:PRC-barrel domain-containing protein [Metabacillus halosaccharovorans]|uniref:PRC-barrel domain-containing protein n=1 Tax=Metabacillus halosaccharovorans TaxID=930124 RepID=A0ABT3DPB2_9BACI|nr:PRC-barrel domain-containing protein [Metabacillus halosaccharovorans]MCV9888903.1 PRC-barrel domain-containing protein [Metabacillus halosaccharovorans]